MFVHICGVMGILIDAPLLILLTLDKMPFAIKYSIIFIDFFYLYKYIFAGRYSNCD